MPIHKPKDPPKKGAKTREELANSLADKMSSSYSSPAVSTNVSQIPIQELTPYKYESPYPRTQQFIGPSYKTDTDIQIAKQRAEDIENPTVSARIGEFLQEAPRVIADPIGAVGSVLGIGDAYDKSKMDYRVQQSDPLLTTGERLTGAIKEGATQGAYAGINVLPLPYANTIGKSIAGQVSKTNVGKAMLENMGHRFTSGGANMLKTTPLRLKDLPLAREIAEKKSTTSSVDDVGMFVPRSQSNYKFPTSKIKTEKDVIHPANLAFEPENIIHNEVHSFLKRNNVDIKKLPESHLWSKNGTDYVLPEGVNHDILNEYARLHHNKAITPEFKKVANAIEKLNPGIKINSSHDLHAVASNIPNNKWWGNKATSSVGGVGKQIKPTIGDKKNKLDALNKQVIKRETDIDQHVLNQWKENDVRTKLSIPSRQQDLIGRLTEDAKNYSLNNAFDIKKDIFEISKGYKIGNSTNYYIGRYSDGLMEFSKEVAAGNMLAKEYYRAPGNINKIIEHSLSQNKKIPVALSKIDEYKETIKVLESETIGLKKTLLSKMFNKVKIKENERLITDLKNSILNNQKLIDKEKKQIINIIEKSISDIPIGQTRYSTGDELAQQVQRFIDRIPKDPLLNLRSTPHLDNNSSLVKRAGIYYLKDGSDRMSGKSLISRRLKKDEVIPTLMHEEAHRVDDYLRMSKRHEAELTGVIEGINPVETYAVKQEFITELIKRYNTPVDYRAYTIPQIKEVLESSPLLKEATIDKKINFDKLKHIINNIYTATIPIGVAVGTGKSVYENMLKQNNQ